MCLFIVYPDGDKDKIQVVCDSYYEKNKYALASRKDFKESEINDAIRYCKKLAKKHGKQYMPYDSEDDVNEYLD